MDIEVGDLVNYYSPDYGNKYCLVIQVDVDGKVWGQWTTNKSKVTKAARSPTYINWRYTRVNILEKCKPDYTDGEWI